MVHSPPSNPRTIAYPETSCTLRNFGHHLFHGMTMSRISVSIEPHVVSKRCVGYSGVNLPCGGSLYISNVRSSVNCERHIAPRLTR